MRGNCGFGNYQAAQTQDKSLEEVDISLLGTKHSPQQWWGMQCQGSQPDPAPWTMCWAPSAPTKSKAGMVSLHPTEVFQSHHQQFKLTAESFNGDLKEICCRTKIELNSVITAKEKEPVVRGIKKFSPLGAIPFAGLRAQGFITLPVGCS